MPFSCFRYCQLHVRQAENPAQLAALPQTSNKLPIQPA
jgi:hypothetical protein